MTEFRYGVVGAGMMGFEHIENVRLIDGSEVVAVADPDLGRRELVESRYGGRVAAFESTDELLANTSLDALVIASPNHTHADVVGDVWASGLPLLVEKPLATTASDAKRLVELAADQDRVVWVGMEYRYMPPIAKLIEEVHAGVVGTPRMLAIREHRFPFLPKVGDWNRFNRNTGGTLVEKCCHFFDLMRLILQAEPIRVFASAAQDVNHLDERYDGEVPDIWDNGFVVFDFESGARALLDLCMFAEASKHQEELAVTGELGKVECFLPASTLRRSVRATRSYEDVDVPRDERLESVGSHHGSTYHQHVAFQRAVRADGRVEVSVEDGWSAVAMGMAAQVSASERRVVEMAEVVD